MTKNKTLSPELQEIIAGQNEAVQRLPKDHGERVAILDQEKKIREDMNDKIAQVKKDAGHASYLDRLTTNHGISPQAIKISNILDGMPARARAATIRHVLTRAEDKNWIVPDMFDNGFGSIKPGDEDAAVFDSTGAGKAQGGASAEPRTTEEMAASHEPKGTGPGLSHDEIVANFEAANKAYLEKGGKGKKPNAWHDAKKALDESNAAREKAEAETGEPAPEPQKPDNVVNFTKQQKAANKAGDDHIRQQSEKKASERASKPAETAREEKKATRPRKKDELAAAPEPAPPEMDADDDEEAPAPAAPPGQIGAAPSSFRMG